MLDTSLRFTNPDSVYQQLIDLHEGSDEQTAMKVSAKLVLLLANHIGEPAIIEEAIAIASRTNGLSEDTK